MTHPSPRERTQPVDLTRFAWLAIAAAVLTIALKTIAWQITGSVGLLSDAAESVVNLVAAIVALVALRVAIMPADKNHHFGHSKAEYFSAALEGLMIFVAAAVILATSIERFLNPRPLENVGIGLAVSVVASVVNGLVAVVLSTRAGRARGRGSADRTSSRTARRRWMPSSRTSTSCATWSRSRIRDPTRMPRTAPASSVAAPGGVRRSVAKEAP